jgi:hypothetical protein
METVSSAVLTIKGLEAKMRPIIEELEKEVPGIQIAFVFAVPEKDDPSLYACTGYLNIDLPILAEVIQRESRKSLDRPVMVV